MATLVSNVWLEEKIEIKEALSVRVLYKYRDSFILFHLCCNQQQIVSPLHGGWFFVHKSQSTSAFNLYYLFSQ